MLAYLDKVAEAGLQDARLNLEERYYRGDITNVMSSAWRSLSQSHRIFDQKTADKPRH